MKMTLSSGRQVTIKIHHNRIDLCGVKPHIKTNGRMLSDTLPYTKVNIYDNTENILGTGTAYCTPPDHFSKKQGIKIALKRAMKLTDLTKQERTEIWKTLIKYKEPEVYILTALLKNNRKELIGAFTEKEKANSTRRKCIKNGAREEVLQIETIPLNNLVKYLR